MLRVGIELIEKAVRFVQEANHEARAARGDVVKQAKIEVQTVVYVNIFKEKQNEAESEANRQAGEQDDPLSYNLYSQSVVLVAEMFFELFE